MSDSSNVEHFATTLERLKAIPDMRNGSGQDALDHVARKIKERADAEQGPDRSWDANQGSYERRKRAAGKKVGDGLGSGSPKMLDLDEIRGRQTIDEDTATMEFGTTEAMNRRGQWFSSGSDGDEGEHSGASSQPERPFYAMDDEDEAEVREIIAEGINRELRGGL